MATVMNTIDIQTVTNDKGDNNVDTQYSIEYNYEEESMEPGPAQID